MLVFVIVGVMIEPLRIFLFVLRVIRPRELLRSSASRDIEDKVVGTQRRRRLASLSRFPWPVDVVCCSDI